MFVAKSSAKAAVGRATLENAIIAATMMNAASTIQSVEALPLSLETNVPRSSAVRFVKLATHVHFCR